MRQGRVNIIGAGLAGSEAAWQIAQRNLHVNLFEMRPLKMTEAHQTGQFAELVCSNSLGSDSPFTSSQLLKEELKTLGSFLIGTARECSVPAGSSLAVDRHLFSSKITELLSRCPHIHIHHEEVKNIPLDETTIIATGPLTSPSLSQELINILGKQSLYFYDAISPIVSLDSLNLDKMFFANRYGKGETADFLNIPLNKDQYEKFVDDLIHGDVVLPHDFEEEKTFESCLPIETIASRGKETLAFGPMKPVGLTDPKTGNRAHAVIQLRAENRSRTAFNLVGFQTKLKHSEQVRIFRSLPGFENAEFLRLGSMHRNTYLDSPQLLHPSLQLRNHPHLFFAGQLTGTEGYVESIATGLIAGINAARFLKGLKLISLPIETLLGALLEKISDQDKKNFQPTNVNMGLLPPLVPPIKKNKRERNRLHSQRSSEILLEWKQSKWKDEFLLQP